MLKPGCNFVRCLNFKSVKSKSSRRRMPPSVVNKFQQQTISWKIGSCYSKSCSCRRTCKTKWWEIKSKGSRSSCACSTNRSKLGKRITSRRWLPRRTWSRELQKIMLRLFRISICTIHIQLQVKTHRREKVSRTDMMKHLSFRIKGADRLVHFLNMVENFTSLKVFLLQQWRTFSTNLDWKIKIDSCADHS